MQNISALFNLKEAKTGNGEKGFSLLEIMVAMVIFMIVTGSIWGVLRVAQQSRSVVNQQVALAKNVRLGLNLLGRDTYNAGFGYPSLKTGAVILPENRISTLLGIPNDFDTTRDTVPPIIAGNNITLSTFNTTAGVRTDQVTFMFKDSTFNVTSGVSKVLQINTASTTGGGIVELTPESGNAACRINDIYLLTGVTGSTLGVSTGLNGTNSVQFSTFDSLGFNQTGLLGVLNDITATSMYRIKMVTYFVTSDGTLTRREFANVPPVVPSVAYADEPLVYNVDNFQIQYVMDNGTLNDNPSAGADGIAGTADDVQTNLAAVRQVRFTISVRSTELNSAGQPYRETMTSTFGTRNLGYDPN